MKLLTILTLLVLPLLAATQTGSRLLTYKEAFSGEFSARRTSVTWVDADADGTYIEKGADGSLIFANINDGNSTTFVDASKLGFEYHDYEIQGSREHVLFSANYHKQYRYSYFADYFVFNRTSGKVSPLVEGQKRDIQYATWSPKGDVIAFVRGNNLFLWRAGVVEQITKDGGVDVFNAVPDWVYEEEIYGTRYTMWFSPDGEQLAFLRMDETGVPTFTVQYYMGGGDTAPPYPLDLDIRYPKVSQKNPTVSFHLLDVKSSEVTKVEHGAWELENLIITEVAWVAEKHERVLFRAMNRVQDMEKIVVVDTATGKAKVVRERDATDGWLDNTLAMKYVPGTGSYLDLSDHTGWMHLYLYPVSGGEPKALTKGTWEVTEIIHIDSARDLVYYLSTQHHSTERHLYSINIKNGRKKSLTNNREAAYWGASFSTGGSYYILSYNGPNIPYQTLHKIAPPSQITPNPPIRTLQDNAALKKKLAEYALPKVNYLTLRHPDGYTLNARETLPANFDPSKKYPVLFDPYGGPGSQMVTKRWIAPGWRTYIGSDPELQYIVLTVDNRGTGYKGRAFRASVTKQLGKLEAADQVWAARTYRRRPYVDGEHIALWGWSFGGYLTAKVLETDSTDAFSLGLITAPVSDWRLYDSMYTERYMKTLELNPAGYNTSAVVKPQGFKNSPGGFVVQHGTGDDNVHFQNSAAMVDMLMREGVGPDKMDTSWFTDSDHSINFHGTTQFLYKQLTKKLYEEKERKPVGTMGLHQWSRKSEREMPGEIVYEMRV